MNKKERISILFPVLFGFFVMGFCDVVGITASHVKEDLLGVYSPGFHDTLSNLIAVALFSMFFIFSIPTGILMNRIGRKKTVILSYIVTIVAMFIPLISYTFSMVLVAFVLLGIANTILQVSLNPLLASIVSGDQLTSNLTTGQFIKAISSFSAPFIAAFAASQLNNWQYIFPIYAVITIVATIWIVPISIDEASEKNNVSSFRNVLSTLKDKTILLIFFGIVFVVGVDVGMNTVSPKILMERCGLSTIEAGYGTSMYFALRTIGTFLGAFVLARYSSVKYFRINMVLAVASLVILIFAADKVFIYTLIGIIGFSIASVFSILFGIALKAYPDKSNEISGLMMTSIAGGAVIPFLMGLFSDLLNSQAGAIVIILICALYLLFAAFIIK